MTQAERVYDFQSRVGYSQESTYIHQQHQWRYIPIHPFGDEFEILQRLELQPTDCLRADAYWEVDGDIVFIETWVHAHSDRDPGLYCRTRTEGGNVAFAVLEEDFVTRKSFEEVMTSYYFSGQLFDAYPDALTLIRSEQGAADQLPARGESEAS